LGKSGTSGVEESQDILKSWDLLRSLTVPECHLNVSKVVKKPEEHSSRYVSSIGKVP